MKVDVGEPSASKRVMDFEIPTEDVKKEFERNVELYQKSVQIRGFRPGKVPRNMVLSRFQEDILSKTVEDMIQKSYEDACKEHQMVPVSQAKIEKVDFGMDKPLKFKAEFEIEPSMELKKYKGLGVKQEKVEVKDEDVNAVVEDLRDRLSSFEKLDRKSKKGDYIRYEYEKVEVDGRERKDYKNPRYPMPVGEAKIEAFNKALVGKSAGESVRIDFTFPADWEVPEIRGKDGSFILKIHEILEKKLPEVNDEFAKKVGNYDSAEAMRARIRDDLLQRRTDQAKRNAQEEVISKIIEENEIILPPSRIEGYAENMFGEMSKYQKGASRDEAMERYRKIGEREIKKYKIIDWVAKSENIKSTQEEVDARIRQFAEARKEDFDAVKERFRRDGTTVTMRSDIREEKTLDWLLENNR